MDWRSTKRRETQKDILANGAPEPGGKASGLQAVWLAFRHFCDLLQSKSLSEKGCRTGS
jgi:hypothetical protein